MYVNEELTSSLSDSNGYKFLIFYGYKKPYLTIHFIYLLLFFNE
jgi:hypothetical protein